MTSSTGGLFARIVLRCYFPNAGGLKNGAVVSLEGVTIGNVTRMRVVPRRNPNPVEVTMEVGEKYVYDLHTDSLATIAAAGVLGDSYLDIDSTHAIGPPVTSGAELQQSGSPTIQSVINTSQVSIQEVNVLVHKIETLVDTLNQGHGTAGELLNDPSLARKIVSIADNLQTISGAIAQGKGTVGALVNDNTLYTKLNSAVDHLNTITADLDSGKGTVGKLLKDETLYKQPERRRGQCKPVDGSDQFGQRLAGHARQRSGVCEKAGRYFEEPRRDRKRYQRGRGHGWRAGQKPLPLRSPGSDRRPGAAAHQGHARESKEVSGHSVEAVLTFCARRFLFSQGNRCVRLSV
ncbi:MAG: MlaD family protein [Terracidiphilus sp.]